MKSKDYWATPEPQPIAAPGTKDCNYPRYLLPSIRQAKLHSGGDQRTHKREKELENKV